CRRIVSLTSEAEKFRLSFLGLENRIEIKLPIIDFILYPSTYPFMKPIANPKVMLPERRIR
ncbi:MAG: hypothetical protein WBZ50_11475, partial [Nitrososphaeraceae archaeon]